MLEIRTERRGRAAVLYCSGRIDMGESLTRLREAVISEIGAPTLVLDLSQVTAIDAAGLGLLMFLHTRGAGRGCELKLYAPSAQVATALALTHLDSVLTVLPPGELDYALPIYAGASHDHDGAGCAFCRQA